GHWIRLFFLVKRLNKEDFDSYEMRSVFEGASVFCGILSLLMSVFQSNLNLCGSIIIFNT
ncbi:hypothetical protein, partial [Saccharococcus caldoxylosilyticus]|uniref:hypothetical protein n=1 Tax=Saccharococcus caldoxylosilyticus TaxID=81408 RepID=UPI001F3CCC65